MKISLMVLWVLAGWCGSELRRINFPPPHVSVPEPPPHPEWLVTRIIGAVTGLIGGWGFVQTFGPGPEPWLTAGPRPEPWAVALFAAATAVGAFVVSGVITDIYRQIRGRM